MTFPPIAVRALARTSPDTLDRGEELVALDATTGRLPAELVREWLLNVDAKKLARRGLVTRYEFLHYGRHPGLAIAVAVALCLMMTGRRAAQAAPVTTP